MYVIQNGVFRQKSTMVCGLVIAIDLFLRKCNKFKMSPKSGM